MAGDMQPPVRKAFGRPYRGFKMSKNDFNKINRDERKEYNKVRARKMVLVLGIVSVILILAMMVEIYL